MSGLAIAAVVVVAAAVLALVGVVAASTSSGMRAGDRRAAREWRAFQLAMAQRRHPSARAGQPSLDEEALRRGLSDGRLSRQRTDGEPAASRRIDYGQIAPRRKVAGQ